MRVVYQALFSAFSSETLQDCVFVSIRTVNAASSKSEHPEVFSGK